MSGRRSRNKGANGERELAGLLTDAFGIPIRRLLGQARDGGVDLWVPPFRIEVKRRRQIAALRYLEQAKSGAGPGQVPTAMLREDGGPWAVLMALPDWLPLAREEIALQANLLAWNEEDE